MNAIPGPRRGAPPPPPHINREMQEAGRTGDKFRLHIANAAYKAWLTDHGYNTGQGNQAPKGAYE